MTLRKHSYLLTFTFWLLIFFTWIACSAPQTPSPPQSYPAFVVNNGSSSLAVVDLANLHLVASIPVAPNSRQVVVRPGSHELWVVGGPPGTISIVRFPQLSVSKILRVGGTASSLVFSADGRHAFVLAPTDGQVVFLECEKLREIGRVRLRAPARAGASREDGAVKTAPLEVLSRYQVAGAPVDLALTPDGKTLVVSGAVPTNAISFVNVDPPKILGSVEVGREPGSMVILPDSSRVFVANTAEEKISAVDIASRQVLSHLEIGSKPGGLVLKPDGGELFVLSPGAATLTIVDAFHDNVEQSIPVGRRPVAAASRRDSTILYIANADDGSVTTLDVQNRTVLASTHIGVESCALALTPDERFLAVADCGSGNLAVLRADRSTLVTTIPVGARPLDVVIPNWLREN